MTGVLVRRGRETRDARTEERPCEDIARGSHGKSRGGFPGGTDPAATWILNIQPPELWEHTTLLFEPPTLWYFVRAAPVNKYKVWHDPTSIFPPTSPFFPVSPLRLRDILLHITLPASPSLSPKDPGFHGLVHTWVDSLLSSYDLAFSILHRTPPCPGTGRRLLQFPCSRIFALFYVQMATSLRMCKHGYYKHVLPSSAPLEAWRAAFLNEY